MRVPESMQGLLAAAEDLVSRYFAERNDDTEHGKIEIRGERFVLLRGAALSVEFFELVRSLYGADKGAEADDFARTILFDLAHAVGKTDARNFHDKMQLTDPIAKLVAGPVHFAHAGWASVNIFAESRPSLDEHCCMIFDHPYSFESDSWMRVGSVADFPVCIMSAGYSSGWSEESIGQPLVAAEILCRGKGDDACRFVMAPPEQIGARIEEYIAAHPALATRAAGFRIPDFFVRKREEEALRKRQEELERELRQSQKIEALGRLAGGIAHDFNNIMSVVLGQAMLAQRRVQPGDQVAKDLAKIVAAAERATALTQQLLAFGRSQVARNEVLELNSVVEAMTQMLAPVIGDDIELTLKLAPDAGCVNADRTQLEQVLMNLAVNARDAMPQGGSLTISTARENTSVRLTVADSGTGMDEATRARAFEPFFTTKGQNGTGLGLSTVYGIVINAGGTISLDTQPGAGCTFSIVLPRIAGERAPGVRNIEIALHGSGRILVVEDRTDVRDVVERALNEFGYDATAVETVDDAISVLSDTQQPLDLLLTDVVMPRMSGVELARRAIALRPKLKVLFMSGYAPDPQHRALFANNDAGFLQKPFTPQQLTAKIAALLNS